MKIERVPSFNHNLFRSVRPIAFGAMMVCGTSLLSGCPAPQVEAPEVADSSPTTPVTVATSVRATAREPHQIVTNFAGNPKVTFTVAINGGTIGSYSTDGVQNDISSSLREGVNDVKIAWTADPSMPSYGSARIKLQTQRDGKWNDIVTREVRRDTTAGEATVNLQIGMPPTSMQTTESATSPTVSTTPAVEETVTSSASAGEGNTASAANSVTDRYVLKTTHNSLANGSFDVSINGQTVGSYNSASNQDISSYLKPGANDVSISWQAAQTITNRFAESKLTIGVFRDGRWSTVANQVISQDQPRGTKTWKLDAR